MMVVPPACVSSTPLIPLYRSPSQGQSPLGQTATRAAGACAQLIH